MARNTISASSRPAAQSRFFFQAGVQPFLFSRGSRSPASTRSDIPALPEYLQAGIEFFDRKLQRADRQPRAHRSIVEDGGGFVAMAACRTAAFSSEES